MRRQGLAVIQGDADTDLSDYPDDAFDYVILSQTLQATRQPRVVLEHMLRIGRHAIVSFPNFGHWRIRLQVLFGGHMPQTDNLPYAWWDSPNIHFCTIKDFRELCEVAGAKMEKGGGAQRLGRAAALQCAVVVLESVRRAGGVPAEPQGLADRSRNASSVAQIEKRPQDGLRRLGSIRLTQPGDGGYRGDGDRPARLDSIGMEPRHRFNGRLTASCINGFSAYASARLLSAQAVADRDLARRDDFAVDAAIGVAEGLHQRVAGSPGRGCRCRDRPRSRRSARCA